MRTGRIVLMTLAALLVAVSLAFVAGCGGDDDDAAEGTTTEATTAAPATTAATTGGEQTNPQTTGTQADVEEPGAVEGDATAGEQFFASTCTSCHMNNGRDAGGVGPQLAGQGLTADVVRATVENGKGAMPPGLAQGADLDNVVAYVISLQ
jgi:mono/diheme cytochrome c family protein